MPVLCRITTYWLLPRNSTVLPSMAGSAWIRPTAGRSVTGFFSFSGTKTARWSFRRCRVLFPDNPQQQTGTERNLHQFSATAGDESYGLEYADYSPNTDWESAVDGERDSIVNGLGGAEHEEKGS